MKLSKIQRKILSWLRENSNENSIIEERETGLASWGCCKMIEEKIKGTDGVANITTRKPLVIGGVMKRKTFEALVKKQVIKTRTQTSGNNQLNYWILN